MSYGQTAQAQTRHGMRGTQVIGQVAMSHYGSSDHATFQTAQNEGSGAGVSRGCVRAGLARISAVRTHLTQNSNIRWTTSVGSMCSGRTHSSASLGTERVQAIKKAMRQACGSGVLMVETSCLASGSQQGSAQPPLPNVMADGTPRRWIGRVRTMGGRRRCWKAPRSGTRTSSARGQPRSARARGRTTDGWRGCCFEPPCIGSRRELR